MKTLRIFLFTLAALSILAASTFAVPFDPPPPPPPPPPPASSDSSHFGGLNSGGTTLPGSGAIPGDMNNNFHDNTGGSGFGSGF